MRALYLGVVASAANLLSCSVSVSPVSDAYANDPLPVADGSDLSDADVVFDLDVPIDVATADAVHVEDASCVEPSERPSRTFRSCSGVNGAPTEHCREAFTCGGRFAMGHPDAWLFDRDIRVRRMSERPCSFGISSVRAGYIDAYPVSVARWRRWVEAGMPQPEDGAYFFDRVVWSTRTLRPQSVTSMASPDCTWNPTPGTSDSLPITCFGAAEAAAFCWWEGKHIVTEQMWEFVARNSATTERSFSLRATAPVDRCRYGDILRMYDCVGNQTRLGTGTAPIDAFPDGRTSLPEGVYIYGGLVEAVRSNRGLNGVTECINGPAGEATYSNGGVQSIEITLKGASYRMTPEHTAMAENPASLVPSLVQEAIAFRCARWVVEPISD